MWISPTPSSRVSLVTDHRSMSSLRGQVLTVTGAVEPKELGNVLPHEYTLVHSLWALKDAEYGTPTDLSDLTFELKNLGKIRQFPYSVRENLLLDSKDDTISELKLFKRAGGGTICDVAPKGLRLEPELLPEMSRESGVKIVAGTAFYVDPLIPDEVKAMSAEEIAAVFVKEITEGIEGSGGVRCGFIGEMGCSYPLTPSEEKGLRAAAIAQRKTGAPLIIHPGCNELSPFQILDVLEAAGADISHTVISHLDRTIFDCQRLLEFAKRGCYLEYDLFGIECSHYQFSNDVDFPSDAQRVQKVKLLLDNGHANQVVLSHDIHSKHRLVKYGGHGYAHILEHIVPKMKERGVSEEHITLMTQDNPQKLLTFK